MPQKIKNLIEENKDLRLTMDLFEKYKFVRKPNNF